MRLIDADALMKDIKGRKTRSYPKGELEWTIEQQPTIEAAPVVYGEWENGCCTNCVQVDFSKPNFCSNCGADMRKGNAEWK